MNITRAALEQHLREQGVEGVALDALLRETAALRHTHRVAVAAATAQAAGGGVALIGAVLCRLDAHGIGGRDGVGGQATDRLPAFQALGKGRKQATDGGAWTAAIAEAGTQLAEQVDFCAAADGGGLTVTDGATTLCVSLCMITSGEDVRWWRTLVREGLRRCAAIPELSGWFHAMPHSTYSGELPMWAALVNAIEEAMTSSASPVA